MFQRRRTSLQRRIIILVAVGMLLMLAVLGVVSSLSIKESINRALRERLLLAQTVAGHLDYVMRQNLIRLQDIGFAPGVDLTDNDLEPERAALHNVYLHSMFTDGVFLLDRSGSVIMTEPYRPGMIGINLNDYISLSQTLTTGRPTVSGLLTWRLTGKKLIIAAVPIKDDQGRIVGLVGGEVDPTSSGLREVVQSARLGNTGYIDIVDNQGFVLGSTRSQNLFLQSDHGSFLANLINKKQTTVGTCHRCHQEREIERREIEVMAFAPLQTIPWGISIRQSEQEALAPARSMKRRFLILGLFLLTVAVVLAWGAAGSVIKSVGLLSRAADQIAQGNLSEPVPVAGEDEIGRLGRSFDLMRQKLKGSLERIEEWNRELEARVKERTEELEVRNRELSALISIANVVGHWLNLEEMLRQALKKIGELVGAEGGTVFLVKEGFLTSWGVSPEQAQAIKYDIQSNAYLYQGQLAESTAVVGKLEGDPVGDGQSVIHIPLLAKEKTLGVLSLVSDGSEAYGPKQRTLLASLCQQLAVGLENATLYEELQRKEESRGELLRKVISAQEEERKRIARELHDETSQALAALVLALETEEGIADAKGLAVKILDDVHRLIFDLRPSLLDDLGLPSAIRWYADNYLEPLGLATRFQIVGNERRLPSEVETALFRVAQEAITNAAKHSEGENVLVRLKFEPDKVGLAIEDDGRGFEPASLTDLHRKGHGWGLLGIRERVSLLNGQFQIESSPGKGTKVMVEVPVDGGELTDEQD
jgi:signal transduction histidine kinase